MTFLRSLLRDTYVIITDLYCRGINNALLAPGQRRNKTVEPRHQTVILSLLAGFSGFWMCLFSDMNEATVAALGCGQSIYFFYNILARLQREAGRVFRWESFAFALSVSVLSEWAIFKMIKSGDERQQNSASKYKIREMERQQVSFTALVIIQQRSQTCYAQIKLLKWTFLNIWHQHAKHADLIWNPLTFLPIGNVQLSGVNISHADICQSVLFKMFTSIV